MSDEPIRLTVRCQRRIHLDVDADGMVRLKCRDCSRAQGRPVYHEIAVGDLAIRRGVVSLPGSCPEDRPEAA